MEILPCGHAGPAGSRRLCRHLIGRPEDDDLEHYRHLTGRGVEWDAYCRDCAVVDGRVLLAVCEGCAERLDEVETDQLGYEGRPEIRDRPEPLDARVTAVPLPAELRGAIDIAPLPGPDAWLVLLPGSTAAQTTESEFALAVWTPAESRALGEVVLPAEPEDTRYRGRRRRPRLCSSGDGRFAVVGLDRGRHGAVVDLTVGRTTMALDQGPGRFDEVPFTAAFAVHRGRTVLVHRTRWNRLDVSDPATGELLTAREHPPWQKGDPRPPHCLDYFHGAVAISPDGRWIADDGWVWGPAGIPSAWGLTEWLATNPWESEDGPTRRALHWRWDWDVPICWVDHRRVAVGGYEGGYNGFLDGARVIDVETGDDSLSFPGPRGRHFFSDGHRLYASADEGLEVWDFRTGERTGEVPGFSPTHHHPGSRRLARLDGDRLMTMRIGSGGRERP